MTDIITPQTIAECIVQEVQCLPYPVNSDGSGALLATADELHAIVIFALAGTKIEVKT